MALLILDIKSTSNLKNITANYMKVKLNDKEIEFPQFCASFSDYNKSDRAYIGLKAKIFQYHINLVKYDNITTTTRQDRLLKNYQTIQTKHSPILNDVNFWWDGHKWSDEEREAALNLQLRMNTDFLSDIVTDRDHDNLDRFEKQLDDLLSRRTDKIKCPSISLKTNKELFLEQLNLFSEKNIQRFNADWTGISNYEQWRILSAFLKDKKIWCNLTGITDRRHRTTKKSYAMFGIAHGVHTVGLGYPSGFSVDDNYVPKSYMINADSFCYEQVHDTHSDICDTKSHNLLSAKIIESQINIKNNTFYDDFLPKDFLP